MRSVIYLVIGFLFLNFAIAKITNLPPPEKAQAKTLISTSESISESKKYSSTAQLTAELKELETEVHEREQNQFAASPVLKARIDDIQNTLALRSQ